MEQQQPRFDGFHYKSSANVVRRLEAFSAGWRSERHGPVDAWLASDEGKARVAAHKAA